MPANPSPSYNAREYPSPKLADLVLIERYDHTPSYFGPFNQYTTVPDYGTAHPNESGMRLVYVKLVDPVKRIYDWYWVNDRSSQDDYNYEIDYPEGDTAYPLVKRTYLIRRSAYTPLAEGTADPSFANCVLTRQRVQRINDPVLDSLYVLVERWFERVPGKPSLSDEEDIENRVIVYTHRQMVEDSDDTPLTLPPPGQKSDDALGADYTEGLKQLWSFNGTLSDWTTAQAYVYTARKEPIDGSNNYVIRVVEYGVIPPTRFDYQSIGFQFPGIYTVIYPNWVNPPDNLGGYTTNRPWAGVDYSLLAPRSMNRPARVRYDFFLEGQQSAIPETFRVESPAAASRFLSIPNNTVHPALEVYEWSDTLPPVIVEQFPASTPPSYNTNDVLLVEMEDATWRGRIKVRRTVEVSETRNPYTFPL